MANSIKARAVSAVLSTLVCLAYAGAAHAQAGSPPAHPSGSGGSAHPSGADSLAKQLSVLDAKVGELQAQLRRQQRVAPPPAMPAAAPAAGGMGGAGGMMGMCSQMMGGMGSTGGGAGMGAGMMGDDMMGGMNPAMGTGAMSIPSALPGFPGASHLYHIGARDYFLDQAAYLGLTAEQQMTLNSIKQKALFDQADQDRQLADAEQDLWLLTSADRPDAAKVESRIRSIEKLRADGRIAFIKAVGEAAKLLNDQQRRILAGMAPPAMPMTTPGMTGSAMPAGGAGGSGMMDDDMMMNPGSGAGAAPMGGAGMGDM